MSDLIQKTFKEKLGLSIALEQVEKLFGQASYRIYYRVRYGERSWVVMQLPPGASSVSEEITNMNLSKDQLPFLNVHGYLERLGLPLPKVIVWDAESSIMILEDLGDAMFESFVKDQDDAVRIPFYKKAIDLLVDLEQKTQERPNSDCIAFERRFDGTLLNWEFDHFLEYGIEDRLQLKIPESEKETFWFWTRKISDEILSAPFCFTHRDFQSRNLMVKDGKFYLIDFQDALVGPIGYDLVALLKDSYIELRPQTVEQLIGYYLDKIENIFGLSDSLGRPWTFTSFSKIFHRITLQRKLKDAGRFQFIHSVKKNSAFLVHLPTSLNYVRQAFDALPEYLPLKEWISKFVAELR